MADEIAAQRYRWSEVEQDHPLEGIARRQVTGRQVMVARVTLRRGSRAATHQHPNEQIACVISGKLRFVIGAEGAADRYDVTVAGGEVLHLPSNVPHSAEALEDSDVLDVFSPPGPTGLDQQKKK